MKNLSIVAGMALSVVFSAATAVADNRLFTYTYEPETEPKGDLEFEQSITSRIGRNAAVGQQNYQKWEFRTEIEYGVTERYTAALYVNEDYTRFTDPATSGTTATARFSGISLENRYLVLDPASNPIGLTLYLEPTYDGINAELEEKIIIGRRHGEWKWALNLTHATEWEDHFRSREGELELSAGLARSLNRRWSVGMEIREHNELPDYSKWENTALYIGPVVSYRRKGWWAALSVMPQVYGTSFAGNPSQSSRLELEGHERLNVRLLFGISF